MTAVPDDDAIAKATARVGPVRGIVSLETEHALGLILLGALAYMVLFRRMFRGL